MSPSINQTALAAGVRAIEPKCPRACTRVSRFLTGGISADIWVALGYPDGMHLFISDQISGFLLTIVSPPIIAWLTSSVLKPPNPTFVIAAFITLASTIKGLIDLLGFF